MKKDIDPRHHHRERVRNDFLLHGIEDYEPHRVLELLLFYAIPRKDTKQIAYRLMQEFATLKAVFDAPIDQLEKIEGISTNSAILIKMIPQLAKRYYVESTTPNKSMLDVNDRVEFLKPLFIGETTECFYLITLDSAMRPVSCKKIVTSYIATEINLYVAELAREVALTHHMNFIIAHNHPDQEKAALSNADENFTKNLIKAMLPMGKSLFDHVVVSKNSFFSYRENIPSLLR
jgi:DNA repair protein RadC